MRQRSRGAHGFVACDHGHFFSSAAAATGWAEEHLDGYVHPVEKAFRLGREVIEQLSWVAARAQMR